MWLDQGKKMVRVIWRTDDEWANIIYKYAIENMMVDTVCTLFELRESDRVDGQGSVLCFAFEWAAY